MLSQAGYLLRLTQQPARWTTVQVSLVGLQEPLRPVSLGCQMMPQEPPLSAASPQSALPLRRTISLPRDTNRKKVQIL